MSIPFQLRRTSTIVWTIQGEVMGNKIKTILICLLLGCSILSLTGCNKNKYYIPEYGLELMEEDAHEVVKGIKESPLYEGNYEDVYVDRHGNLVFVVTEEQREKLLLMYKGDVEYIGISYARKDIFIDYDEGYTEISITCKRENYGVEVTVEDLEFLMSKLLLCQAFIVDDADDIHVYGCIKDSETGEVLYEYNLPEKK